MDVCTQTTNGQTPSKSDFMGALYSDVDTLCGDMHNKGQKALKTTLHPASTDGRDMGNEVLTALLNQFSPLDFRERAGLSEGDKITRKIYVIVAIDEIIEKATTNNWGLCVKDGFIYLFNGCYWLPVNTDEFKPFLADAALRMGVPQLEARYHQFKDEMYRQFMSEANMPTPIRTTGITLINLQNGTFEITDKEQRLRDFDRTDFLKYQLPFEYDPTATCPMFDKYLEQVLPDQSCRHVLSEYVGYIFTNGLKLEKAAILYGTGANGKSVFFEIMSALIGANNICSYSLQSLTKPDGYQRAELANKLLNYATEINGKLETSIFKQLVSGEAVEARQIYGKPFTMREYGKLMFNCNELPREVEQTNAFFRRFIIIPFTQTIAEADQDPELSDKIVKHELSGVFNWMLDGLKRLLKQRKFTQSDAIARQLDDFRRESDSVASFMDEEYTTPENVFLKVLYAEYRAYCNNNGYTPVSSKTLSKRLRALGHKDMRTRNGVLFCLNSPVETVTM